MPGRPSVLICLLVAALAAVAAGCAPGGGVAPAASGSPHASVPTVAPAQAQDKRPRGAVPASVKLGFFVGGLGWVSLALFAALKLSERTGRGVRECFESSLWVTEPLWGHPAIYWMFGWMLLWGTVFVLLVVL